MITKSETRVVTMHKNAQAKGLYIVSRPRGPVKIHKDDSKFSGMVKGV